MTNIQTALATATQTISAHSDTAQLDAEVLLCQILSKPRSHLRAWPKKLMTAEQNHQFQQLIKKRQQGQPIAYITGHREFWSRDFKVSSDVLIPRPDTELLIELSLNLMADKTKARVIDLGTGSGVIAITLAAERPNLEVIATDISHPALKIAKQNAAIHQLNNIQFLHSDWFNDVPAATKFDLIISNPPYIEPHDPHLSEGDLRFEPESALIAAEQGLKDIRNICQQARSYLKADATLLIEHGFEQQKSVQTIFNSLQYTHISPFTDLSNNPRVTTGQWQHEH
ncbi:MAG: peptide chain release factor N(5)-glutamine methyltransferase [Methylococcales symbiont of Hymedesmia sp. n. MRB-2018]|nr:MAG: peptide chain release factor N(5)-glutamine methyltransferase [Methylococcales symbiont of Hymedesmia sp. n. MRB-2018]